MWNSCVTVTGQTYLRVRLHFLLLGVGCRTVTLSRVLRNAPACSLGLMSMARSHSHRFS